MRPAGKAAESQKRRCTTGRPKYGGLDVSEAKRLRTLEEENRKLKKLLAESMLDNAALKELLSKKMVGARRQARGLCGLIIKSRPRGG